MENTVDVKPAREKKSKAKVETKAETKAETGTDNEVKTEKKDEQKTETAQERKPREPQMVTANGEKVTHGHAYQSTTNPADWYFTARLTDSSSSRRRWMQPTLLPIRTRK